MPGGTLLARRLNRLTYLCKVINWPNVNSTLIAVRVDYKCVLGVFFVHANIRAQVKEKSLKKDTFFKVLLLYV